MTKVECECCGCIHDEYWMMSFSSGRTKHWLCWDCYKESQYEVNKSNLYRQKKLYKIMDSKKRHK